MTKKELGALRKEDDLEPGRSIRAYTAKQGDITVTRWAFNSNRELIALPRDSLTITAVLIPQE